MLNLCKWQKKEKLQRVFHHTNAFMLVTKMEPRQWGCVTPGCNFRTELLQGDVAIEYLKLHVSQVHGVCSKSEKTKKTILEMVRDTIPALDWDSFIHMFNV